MTDQATNTTGRMQVGVFLPMAEEEATGITPRYQEIRALAVQSEELGFDSVWLMDHLLFRHEGQPSRGVWEGWTLLAALAEATQRVTLGTLVLCTAFRNPAMLAKMAVTLDEISRGRLILGLGAGWHQPEFDAFGLPFDHRVGRFEEALQIISPLLREGHVDFHGAFYQAPNLEILPRGPSPRGPRILIGSSGSRMLRLLARHADMWNTCWLGQPPGPLLERRQKLEEACVAEGRDPSTVGVTVGVSFVYPDPGRQAKPVEHPERALRGSPEEVAAGLREYERLGVSHVICWLDQRNTASVAWLAQALKIWRDAGPPAGRSG